jgi:mono/diheme cytochrome c family protein
MTRFEMGQGMARAWSRPGRAGAVLALALAACGDAGSSSTFAPESVEPDNTGDVGSGDEDPPPSPPLWQPSAELVAVDRLCAAEPERDGCEVRRLELALDQSCGMCHGSELRSSVPLEASDGMFWIDDFAALSSDGKITSCDADGSRLVRRATDGSMPPVTLGMGNALDATTLDGLRAFIDGMCTDLTGEGPGSAERHAVEASLRDSCGSCHGAEAAAAGNIQGELGEIENLLALVGNGQIRRCGSRESALLQRVRDGSMPPAGAPNPRLSGEQIDALAAFVDRPCARPAIE